MPLQSQVVSKHPGPACAPRQLTLMAFLAKAEPGPPPTIHFLVFIPWLWGSRGVWCQPLSQYTRKHKGWVLPSGHPAQCLLAEPGEPRDCRVSKPVSWSLWGINKNCFEGLLRELDEIIQPLADSKHLMIVILVIIHPRMWIMGLALFQPQLAM